MNKVFLCSDIFLQRRSYYVVAPDHLQAEEKALDTSLPEYLDQSPLEYDEAEVLEEVTTILLVKIETLSSKPTERVRLIPTHTNDQNVYQGYLVQDDHVEVTMVRTYLKTEWHQVTE